MKNIVLIKIGAEKLFQNGKLVHDQVELFDTIQKLHSKNKVIIVASGAINFGSTDLPTRPDDYSLSALSSIGQPQLIKYYEDNLKDNGIRVAQCLITHSNLQLPKFMENIQNVIHELLECDYIPIVNSNDTVSEKELNGGDNHQLSLKLIEFLGIEKAIVYLSKSLLHHKSVYQKVLDKTEFIEF